MNTLPVPAWWAHAPPMPPWPGSLDLVADLGADSLELLGMATALAEALQLDGAALGERLLARPVLAAWAEAARAGLRADGGVTFRTSASAGTPKRCSHTLAALWQETAVLADLLPGRRRILSAVPSHHIYGFLFTVLLPRALGIDDVVDLRAAPPAAWLATARPGDLVVAHPGWWEALARLDPAFGPDIAGVSSTAPCPDALADGLAGAGLRLLQVYGSSETAGVGWRDAGGAPLTLIPPRRAACRTAGRRAIRCRTSWPGTTRAASSPPAASTTRCRWAASMCFRPTWPMYCACTRRWPRRRCAPCARTRGGG
jgi:long-chain acyl-CoA synthetase